MLFRYSYIIIFLFVIGCSSGPEFKRDNLFDPQADSPKAKFSTDCCNYVRAVRENDSFVVIANAAVVNKNLKLELKSDLDGLIFSQNNVTSGTFKVGYTTLSGPALHTISLFIDGVKQDETTRLVNIAAKVNLYEPTWKNFQPILTWSKYQGEDFESYKLKVIELRNPITVKEFTDINDTSFALYDLPIKENLKYFVETSSTELYANNSSNQIELKPNIFSPPYANSIIKSQNDDHLYFNYSSCTGLDIECSIYSYSSKYDLITTTFTNGYDSQIRFFSPFSLSDLFIFKGDDLFWYDSINHWILPYVQGLAEKVEIEDFISSIYYDPATSIYFVSFEESGPFMFDSNFEPIENNLSVDDKNATLLLGTNENTLFAVGSYYPYSLIAYTFNQYGDLTKTNEKSLYNGSRRRAISNKHNKLFLDNDGKIFSADPSLDELGYLPSVNRGYSSFHIKESSQDTLYAGTNEGYLHKIHIPSNQIVFSQKYDYPIKRILSYNDELFLILNSRYDYVIVPKRPDDLNLD